jgi:acyl-CoA thioesterase
MTPEELARACADAMWASDNACPGLGMTLEDVGPGRAVMSMVVTQAMANGFGICHGGFIFTLADSAFAYACNAFNQRSVAAQCDISFLRPARLGEVLIARAERRTEAGRTGIYDVRVSAGAEIVAEFRGHSRTLGQKFFEELP